MVLKKIDCNVFLFHSSEVFVSLLIFCLFVYLSAIALSIFSFSASRKGELISQKNDFLLPQFNQNPSLLPAQNVTLCPANLIRPRNASCFISGTFKKTFYVI